MDPRVTGRFIRYMTIALVAAVLFGTGYIMFGGSGRAPGDYEVRKGDILLGDKQHEDAIEWFNNALEITPNHRGALMGRAAALIQLERYPEAIAELDYVINFLGRTLDDDDDTGLGALAAAYANRGIIRDRQGQHEQALADYIKSLEIDEGAVSGPDFIYKVLYDPRPSNVRKRARYIYEQLQKPEDERLMTVPELDAKQRMYKP